MTVGQWIAKFPCDRCMRAEFPCTDPVVDVVNIERVEYKDPPERWVYYYVSRGNMHIGVYPGTADPNWIEYLPEPKLVERDGELWWHTYDTFGEDLYVQMTKGDACNSSSIATASR